MNFFTLLNAFYDRLELESRMRTHHVCLYLVLFHIWNKNRFSTLIPLYRENILNLTKIGSLHTYYKCLRDLQDWGYITYYPAKNASHVSKVKMHNLELVNFDVIANAKTTQADLFAVSNSIQAMHHAESNSIQVEHQANANMHHVEVENASHIRHTLQTNIDSIDTTAMQNQHKQNFNNSFAINNEEGKRKKVAAKKENEIPPNELDVIEYFEMSQSTKEVAQKFHLYYTSIGWVNKNNRKIVDWQATAQFWIQSEFKTEESKGFINHNGIDYDEKF